MKFAVQKNGSNEVRDRVAEGVVETFKQHGHELTTYSEGTNFLLNITDIGIPKVGWRKTYATFVVSVVAIDHYPDDFRKLCYKTLVGTLSNQLVTIAPAENGQDGSEWPYKAYFSTPEGGFFHVPAEPGVIYERMLPIVSSRFAIGNEFSTNLPQRYWEPSPIVEQIRDYGRELKAMGVLPTPFPLDEVLTKEELDHLYKIYGVTGASYGNVSARERTPELGPSTFWMSGRGVDKANLRVVGTDVFLITGFDYENRTAQLSVPPVYNEKGRVSIDALEHELIYRTFPEIGAIVHAHAWMEGIPSTRQSYPCGTVELAEEVLELLKSTATPTRTVVGLKNHGITATGPNLEDIFRRLRGRLLTQVPMFP